MSFSRFEEVCLECGDWDECSGCAIERGDTTSACEAPLEHTTADEDGITLATLNISAGYWRTSTESDNILACFNANACRGGVSESGYCSPGYKGPCKGAGHGTHDFQVCLKFFRFEGRRMRVQRSEENNW